MCDHSKRHKIEMKWQIAGRNCFKMFERQFWYFGITEPELKKDRLVIYDGETLEDLEQTLPEVPNEDGGDNVYTKLVNKLNKHFLLK